MNDKENKPTVVIATGAMNAGGTESLIMEMLRHSTGRVRYIMLIHCEGAARPIGVFDEEIRRLGVEMEYIGSIGSLGIRGYIAAFKRFATRTGRINIVHSHLNASGGVISMAAKKCGISHRICHCHADINFTGSLANRLKNEVSLKIMMALIELYATDRWACSLAAWRRLFLPWHKRVVVNNMIDARKYIASEEKRVAAKDKLGLVGKFVVGSVGRVAPIKNYECILKALAGTDAHFVCFGRFSLENTYCRNLSDLARRLGVEERVHWMGNSKSVCDDIHCIDLFVMPSFTEGFGMAAIEAQAASIPSLLSTGVPEIVDLGIGLVKFLSPNNAEEWHKEMSGGIKSIVIPAETILEAFGHKEFDSVAAVKKIEDMYIALVNQ